MKKTIFILSALLLGLVSCNKVEFEPTAPNKAEETGLVAVTMKLVIPEVELQAETKAVGDRSDKPSIKAIRVAVFGSSGFPQAYNLAEPIRSATDESPGSYATENGQVYYFKVLLPIYEGNCTVHIIANGDESINFVDETGDQSEATIMENMKTTGNVGAFWARVEMPDGILAQLNTDGIMQTDDEGNFIPSPETAHLFKDLVLVRNFAEVVLTSEAPNLRNITWTLVNVPTMGSVAPMAGGSYVDNYKDYVYNTKNGKMILQAKDPETGVVTDTIKTYDGFMFPEDPMDYSIPAGDAISNPLTTPNFVYERYLPTEKATCILMKAQFSKDGGTTWDTDDNGQPKYTYYRLDLMDEKVGGYYPIYRNYKYAVHIHKVGNRGAKTPTEAMNRDSGGNVSQTTEAKKLTDISDGESRLYVEYVERNFITGGQKVKGLWVQYVPDVTDTYTDASGKVVARVNNTNVSIRIKDQGTALKAGTQVTLNPDSSVDGTYFYDFELNGQSINDLVSVLEVTATNYLNAEDVPEGKEKSTLYRDITIRVLKTMDLSLDLVPKKIAAGSEENTVLKIILPDNLPESMFPLEMHIEDVNHTLNPTGYDGNDPANAVTVPVKTDKSLADGTTNSFYFIRTVNKGEYDKYVQTIIEGEDTTILHIISTEFEPVQTNSATTIYVANEYFHTKSINLLNDGLYINPTHAVVPFNATSFEIQVESEDNTKTWTVTTSADVTVKDINGNTVTGGTGSGTYTLNFPANPNPTTAQRTATFTSGSDSHTVTITQEALQFSITPEEQTVNFNVQTATVTVHAKSGQTWTVSVNNGATISATSGTGTQNLTVTMGANSTTSQRNFVVTATLDDEPDAVAHATVIQRRGPDSSYPFTAGGFTMNNYNGSSTSGDGFVTVTTTQSQRSGTGDNAYLTLGRRSGFIIQQTQRGSITVTPSAGVRITSIKVTYSNATYAGYDFGNTRVSVNNGTYTRDGNNSNTATWTPNGTYTGAVTFTNGYQNNNNNYNFPRITKIEVFYEPTE